MRASAFRKDVAFDLESPDRITIRSHLQVINDRDHLSIVYSFSGCRPNAPFFRTADGFVFFDDMERGVEVPNQGNTILVRRNGRLTTGYTIESLLPPSRSMRDRRSRPPAVHRCPQREIWILKPQGPHRRVVSSEIR